MSFSPEDLKEYGYGLMSFCLLIWFVISTIKDKKSSDKVQAEAVSERIGKLEKEYDELKAEAKEDRDYIKNELVGLIKMNDATFKEHTQAYRDNTKMFKKMCEHIGRLDKYDDINNENGEIKAVERA